MGFRTEKELFETALSSSPIQHLRNLYSYTTCLVEPQGLFGIPDLVIVTSEDAVQDDMAIIAFAFEMKLSNWKRALIQAFRYRAFAEFSFVMLDRKHIRPALKQIERFERANIGLMSIDDNGNLSIHYQPYIDSPFCNQTRSNLENMFYKSTQESDTENSSDWTHKPIT